MLDNRQRRLQLQQLTNIGRCNCVRTATRLELVDFSVDRVLA